MQAIPEPPYLRKPSLRGAGRIFILNVFDSTAAPVQPSTPTYRIDSLDSAQTVQGVTSVTPTGTTQTLQIPGAVMQLTRQWYGRDNFQVSITATYTDSSTGNTSTAQQVVVTRSSGSRWRQQCRCP